MKRYVFGCVAWMMLALTPLVAQDYPTKPVRIVVGFAAGSVSDIVARLVAQKLEASLGKPFVVEVRPGAGSNVAAQHVVRSAKDGYTLFVATSSSTIRSPTAGFDFSTDLAPVALISSVPFVLAAYPGLGAKTVRDFIAMAKSKPRELTFGGSGVGTTGYLVAQLFNQRAGTDLAIAPYPSTVQATTDLMTGRISVAFASVSNVVQLIETGKLTALAMAQPTRSALLPDTPTIDEAGLPGVHAQHLDRDARAGGNATRDRGDVEQSHQRGRQIRGCHASAPPAGNGSTGGQSERVRAAHQEGHGGLGRGSPGERGRQVGDHTLMTRFGGRARAVGGCPASRVRQTKWPISVCRRQACDSPTSIVRTVVPHRL